MVLPAETNRGFMMLKLNDALDRMDGFVKRYADQAIDEKGGTNYRLAPKHYFKFAAIDHNLRNPGWMITYRQGNQSTTQETIGENPDLETQGLLMTTIALAGKAVKDDSEKVNQPNDNWGNRQFLTQEERRRFEQQSCRAVAVRYAELIQQYCNIGGSLFITDFNIDDNLPHIDKSTLIWWPVTINVNWKLWWRK